MSEHSPGTQSAEILDKFDLQFKAAVGGTLDDVSNKTADTSTAMNLLRYVVAGVDAEFLASVGGTLVDIASKTADTATAIALLRYLVGVIDAIPTTMVGTDGAALASEWTAALATALGNYTAVRAGYIDALYKSTHHLTYIFPTATDLTCTLTAHADANTWSAWAEVVDSGATALSSIFGSADGHVSSMVAHSANQDDTDYMVELAYGAAKTHLSAWRIHSQTGKLSSSGQSKCRGAHVPAGETVYARVMCATAGAKTLLVHFRHYMCE